MDNLPQHSNHTGDGEMNNYVAPPPPQPVPVSEAQALPTLVNNVVQNTAPHPHPHPHPQPQVQQVNTVPVMGTLQTVLTQGINPVVNHTPPNSSPAHEHANQILTRMRLQDLVREVDPNEQLDEDVEEVLLQMADDFVDSAITAACLLAKHRKSNTVEVKDLQLHLERNWNMWIPGFGTDELRPYKRSTVTEAHKQRLTLIRKTLKKY